MDRYALIEAFNKHANEVLQAESELDLSKLEIWKQHDAVLVDQMHRVFKEACDPTDFETHHIKQANAHFEQVYRLLDTTFDRDVLAPYEYWYDGFKQASSENSLSYGRFWRVSGNHRYDTDGKLIHFHFDPLLATESVASYCDGSYLAMEDGRAIVGIGYAVTRSGLRKGQGHGRAVVEQVEKAARELATKRGDTLEMIMLESEARARPFWFRMGYRWAQGSIYFQPAMEIDLDTGLALRNYVPELLMIKDMANDKATTVDRERLLELVQFLYTRWFYQTCNNEEAQEKHRSYIYDDLFGQFKQSLPPDVRQVPLLEPPMN